MPYINIRHSNSEIKQSETLLKDVSSAMARLTNKPEQYVMVSLESTHQMFFAGTNEPCCYIDVKSIGNLYPKEISKTICSLISRHINIPPSRIYINFDDVEASQWGFNSNTFG